jgi:DNA-directed RNA polymerase specialized sigma24 family protein
MSQIGEVPPDEFSPLQQGTVEPIRTRDELLALIDWEDYTPRLLAYARSKVWRHGGAAARYALQAHDLVGEAVTLWLESRRIYKEGTESAFFGFLCGIVDSLLSHEKEKAVRHGRQISISKEGGDERRDEISEGRIRAEGDFEHDLLFRDNVAHFIESLDEDLAAYARFVANNPDTSAAERALALRITVTDIRNLDRRLHRHGREWMKQ